MLPTVKLVRALIGSVAIALLGSCTMRSTESIPQIYNGGLASEGKFLSTVLLDSINCTGTIISSRHILTAAHCIVSSTEPWYSVSIAEGKELKVRFGSIPARPQYFTLVKSIAHPSFIGELIRLKNEVSPEKLIATAASNEGIVDIAIIEVEESLPRQAAALYSGPIEKGSKVTLQGYGENRASSSGAISDLHFFQASISDISPTRFYFNGPNLPTIDTVREATELELKNIRKVLLESPSLTRGDSGGAVYLSTPEGYEIACVNSGGLPKDLGMNPFDYLIELGFSVREIVGKDLISTVGLWPYHCSRINGHTGESSVLNWIKIESNWN